MSSEVAIWWSSYTEVKKEGVYPQGQSMVEAGGEHFQRDLTHPTLHLALRTEEGRLDDLFANLQKSVFNIINKTRLTDTLKLFLGRFMEMATPS